jgi:hypothetical protein
MLIVRFGTPLVIADGAFIGVLGGIVLGLVIVVWWVFFSRASRLERFGALAVMVVSVLVTPRILHPSIVGGAMGFMFYIYVIPGLSLALFLWAAISRRLPTGPRLALMVFMLVASCAAWALVRTAGTHGRRRFRLSLAMEPDR